MRLNLALFATFGRSIFLLRSSSLLRSLIGSSLVGISLLGSSLLGSSLVGFSTADLQNAFLKSRKSHKHFSRRLYSTINVNNPLFAHLAFSLLGSSFIIKRYNHSLPLLSWNPDKIKEGNFGYTKDILLPSNIRWDKGKNIVNKLGNIDKYFFSEDYDIGRYKNFNENVKRAQEIFNLFSPLNSYSLAVVVTQNRGDMVVVKTIDMHYLVNNTTNVLSLMKHIYSRIELLSIKYRFSMQDNIIFRYKALYLKVKDPELSYSGGRINNTVYKPDSRKLDMNSRLLSPNWLPQTMNLLFYGVALSYKENTISYLYNDKFIINVKIVIYNEHHVLTIYRKKEDGLIFLVNVEDVMHDNTLIRSFESGKNANIRTIRGKQ